MPPKLIPYAGQESVAKDGPLGFYQRSPNPRIAITFDQDQFDKISMRAQAEGRSFANMVRRLCSAALSTKTE